MEKSPLVDWQTALVNQFKQTQGRSPSMKTPRVEKVLRPFYLRFKTPSFVNHDEAKAKGRAGTGLGSNPKARALSCACRI